MSKQLKYVPQLDSVRAIAALMVLCAHYFENLDWVSFSYGGNGVQIFFVISGFLITSILLAQKQKAGISKVKMIGKFIVKRALRLFPVYYVFLLILMGLSYYGGLWICEHQDRWYYFLYAQNYLFFVKGFQSPLLNHSWSLAVEEQFYLLWPLVVFFIPRRAEFYTFFFVFLVGVISKIWLAHAYTGAGTIKGITFIHFDTLGAGALLAYLSFYHKEKLDRNFSAWALWLFLSGLFVSVFLTYVNRIDAFFAPISLTLMSLGLVYIAFNPSVKTLLSPVLNLKPLQYVGKISYGVYLFHKPVPFFFGFVWSKMHLAPVENKFVLFTVYTVITLVISVLSWKFFEQPLLKLKERFDV